MLSSPCGRLLLLLSVFLAECRASENFPTRKFESWYPYYRSDFQRISSEACNNTLEAYLHPDLVPVQDTDLLISEHIDCMLKHTSGSLIANMAKAGVILGLLPSFLSMLGPSLAESSVLLLERPILGILLTVGAPAISATRPSRSQDPFKAVRTGTRLTSMKSLPRESMYIAMSIGEYLLAIGAAVNVITVALELGLKSILIWKKANSYLPLIWVLLPIIVHLLAALRMQYHYPKPCWARFLGTSSNHRANATIRAAWKTYMKRLVLKEINVCAKHQSWQCPPVSERSISSTFTAGSIEVLVLVHLIFGTSILSSLLFIAVNDTWVLVIRFAISAIIAQLIINFEIACLRTDTSTMATTEFKPSHRGWFCRATEMQGLENPYGVLKIRDHTESDRYTKMLSQISYMTAGRSSALGDIDKVMR